ncbi:hypothetical protein RD792_015058 [Penstemon davidsonii]|uniref:RING-type E3 ubiquitin transferase n=1 Tax=Penstemon davidsonii TaxID=160366 RepID=A0ABR0CSS9_9LAMI|nr:hypothetical protein RD792_015058 [Penstemon davidsonii]
MSMAALALLVRLTSRVSSMADGGLLGLGVSFVAYRCIREFTNMSSAIANISDAPYVNPSDLHSLLSDDSDSRGKLVIVRGTVEVKSAVVISLRSTGNDVVVSQSGDKGVILKNIQTVPFILVEKGNWPLSRYVTVDVEGSRHPLPPLTEVYHHLQSTDATPFTFLQAILGFDYPIMKLEKEKILPIGKDMTVVGICSLKDGIPQISSCSDLPYFLYDSNKDQLIADISFNIKFLKWSGIVLGSLAIGILGYSIARNWIRWRERRRRQQARIEIPTEDDEESEDVPNEELCVLSVKNRQNVPYAGNQSSVR